METRLALALMLQWAVTEVIAQIVQVQPKEYPFVALIKGSNSLCTGSIITKEWVITAATCVKDSDVASYNVFAGVVSAPNFESSAQERCVITRVLHPDYEAKESGKQGEGGGNVPYNVALLRVEKPFEMNEYVESIGLSGEAPPFMHENCTGMWFNSMLDNTRDTGSNPGCRTSDEPLGEVELVSNAEYYISPQPKSYSGIKRAYLKDAQYMTATKLDKAQPCEGTCGKPMVCGDVQTGVYTFDASVPPRDQYVEVFSVTAFFKDWIKSVAPKALFFRPCKGGGWEPEEKITRKGEGEEEEEEEEEE